MMVMDGQIHRHERVRITCCCCCQCSMLRRQPAKGTNLGFFECYPVFEQRNPNSPAVIFPMCLVIICKQVKLVKGEAFALLPSGLVTSSYTCLHQWLPPFWGRGKGIFLTIWSPSGLCTNILGRFQPSSLDRIYNVTWIADTCAWQ